MQHKWEKEERKAKDGRPYWVTICPVCGKVREKAWTGYLYYDSGYDPLYNCTGNIGVFQYKPGECVINYYKLKPPAR